MKEKEYNIILGGEIFARSNSKKRALRIAKHTANVQNADVAIEARRPIVMVKANGLIVASERGWENL